MRPIVYEFRVFGRFDGASLAPAVLLPPDPASPVDADQFILQTIPGNLGLIDLTGGGPPGQFAGRFVKWIEIVGPRTASGTQNVGVAFDGVLQRTELEIPAAANGIYSENCIFVPQTAQLRLANMVATLAEPIVVRIAVWRPQTLAEVSAIIETCCCLRACINIFGQPCFTRGIYASGPGERTVSSAVPGTVARGASSLELITGTGFTATDVWAVVRRGDGLPGSPDVAEVLPITLVTNLSGVNTEITVFAPTSATPGTYDIVVAPDLGPQYAATLVGGLTVT